MTALRFVTAAVLIAAIPVALPSPANAANEPPIVAFEALVDDNVLFTRRRETYPLVAAYRDKLVDLATVPKIGTLLKAYPGTAALSVEKQGGVCTQIPILAGPSDWTTEPSSFSGQNAPRKLSLVVLSTGGIAVSRDGLGVPAADDDVFSLVRQVLADRFGGEPRIIALQRYGDWDYNRDGVPETVIVGSAPGGAEGVGKSALVLANERALTLPVYIYDLPENAEFMGVADLDGDRRPEMIVRTSQGGRDFGVEIHAWKGRNILKVFERRSYGCF